MVFCVAEGSGGYREAARAELLARGVAVSDVDDQPWGRFVHFADPDGNTWALQQLPPRAG